MERNRALLAAALLLAAVIAPARANPCTAESDARSVALLELYTSEGCNSCPPTDRWVSELPARGHGPASVVALAFHVDYWNYLGWRDPFSKAQYSDRQRAANIRNRARVVYTPQLLLNGKDYRRGTVFDGFGERLAAVNRIPSLAKISLRLEAGEPSALDVTGTASVPDAAARPDAQVFLALYENNLSNDVKAGENRGKRLRHDFVVRELAGPYPVGSDGEARLAKRFSVEPRWKIADLNVAAFVQSGRSGDVLQALATPYCR